MISNEAKIPSIHFYSSFVGSFSLNSAHRSPLGSVLLHGVLLDSVLFGSVLLDGVLLDSVLLGSVLLG